VFLVLLSALGVGDGWAIRGLEEGAWFHGAENGSAVLHPGFFEKFSCQGFLGDVRSFEIWRSRDMEADVFADGSVVCPLEAREESCFEVVGGRIVGGADEDIIDPNNHMEVTGAIGPFPNCVRAVDF